MRKLVNDDASRTGSYCFVIEINKKSNREYDFQKLLINLSFIYALNASNGQHGCLTQSIFLSETDEN